MNPILEAPVGSFPFLWQGQRRLFLSSSPLHVERALDSLAPWGDLAQVLTEEAPADTVELLQGLGSLHRRASFEGEALSPADFELAQAHLRLFAEWADGQD